MKVGGDWQRRFSKHQDKVCAIVGSTVNRMKRGENGRYGCALDVLPDLIIFSMTRGA